MSKFYEELVAKLKAKEERYSSECITYFMCECIIECITLHKITHTLMNVIVMIIPKWGIM